MFHAGACASCHALPGSDEDGPVLLGGGHELITDFGTFRVPNISPDPFTGIGRWSPVDFANAMHHGTSPQGRHYYPAFPYPSYTRMKLEDVLDLKAYLDTLPAVEHAVSGHDLSFPWNLRRGIGLWKLRYLDSSPVVEIDETDELLVRGRYLAEGPAHCGECHTARDRAGGMRFPRWLGGAPNPDGEGRVPNITPHDDGLGDWSLADITYYFKSGLTPDYDTSSGSMVAVQENLAQLPESDRKAIAAYLKALPALADTQAEGD
jgi:mono/diheme cytochrome c family protein